MLIFQNEVGKMDSQHKMLCVKENERTGGFGERDGNVNGLVDEN